MKKQKKKRFVRRKRKRSILLVSLLVLVCLGILAGQKEDPIFDDDFSQLGTLEVHFLDVGQGDSTLLLCNGHAMLIDAGDDKHGTKIQKYLEKQGIKKLDYLVLTHPDADHIGGAPVIITKFEIGKLLMTDYEKETVAYEKVMNSIRAQRLKWSTPEVGSVFSLGSSEITVMGPCKRYEEPNNSSIVLMVEHGKSKFLFTGDMEEEAEKDLMETWQVDDIFLSKKGDRCSLQASVLKLAHHGSSSSGSTSFLDAVKPQYAVISCGEDNDYGFPHAQTLNRLRERKVEVFRTDEQGSVVVISDCRNLSWNCGPSETWQDGNVY